MLITSGNSMWGTVYDDINKMALQLNVGDCLTFGSFVPIVDSPDFDIRLPMLWHVVDRKENKLKLLSYFFFEHAGYWSLQSDIKAVTWENTEIRRNLNDKYFYNCFNENERNAILTTDVKTRTADSGYIFTKDKLYVPALEDIENIPDHLKIGRCWLTERTDTDTSVADLMYCFYWLRDPGELEDENLVVQGYADSKLFLDSIDRISCEVGVRAVMWVDAEKIIECY